MQMMMATSTFGLYLNEGELSRFLDMPANALREVLLPQAKSSIGDHEMFLRTFGIRRGHHDQKPCWHLLGCGHLVTLGYDKCTTLAIARPQPKFWTGMQHMAHGTPENTEGIKARTVLEISEHTKDVGMSLQCRNCKPNNPRNIPQHQ